MSISISCIIVNNLNDSFVKKRLIPSILTNTDSDVDLEIIVVDNSPEQNFKYKNIKVVKSEPFHLPKAFNIGVKNSTKKYLAFFHDDCEILEKNWVNKLVSNLTNEIIAVGPELHTDVIPYNKITCTEYLKEVPLVIKKKNFLDLGGYSEEYYFGYEDIILSDSIIKLGKKIKKIDIDYNHFNGMSTVLINTKYNPEISDEKYKNIKEKFTTITSLKSFRKYEIKILNSFKVDINTLMIPLWGKIILWFLSIFTGKINIGRGLTHTLGYMKAYKYWDAKYNEIPTEIITELQPKTKNDMETFLEDVRTHQNGKLYNKLDKYKNKIFVEYFKK